MRVISSSLSWTLARLEQTSRSAHHWQEAKASAWSGDPQRLTVFPWLQQMLEGQDKKVCHLFRVGVPVLRIEVSPSNFHHSLWLAKDHEHLQLRQRDFMPSHCRLLW